MTGKDKQEATAVAVASSETPVACYIVRIRSAHGWEQRLVGSWPGTAEGRKDASAYAEAFARDNAPLQATVATCLHPSRPESMSHEDARAYGVPQNVIDAAVAEADRMAGTVRS